MAASSAHDSVLRVRFHGRGGQGIKTASRILGSALFFEGFEVQDAPRYGAERRGAAIFAYVRASRQPIAERGIIREPDLVVVVDDSVIAQPGAGVMAGVAPRTVLLLCSATPPVVWQERLHHARVIGLEPSPGEGASSHRDGVRCAGAAARLAGVVGRVALERAVREELGGLAAHVVEDNAAQALATFDAMAAQAGAVGPGAHPDAATYDKPQWLELELDVVERAAPAMHTGLTSVLSRTGLWRTERPVVANERCHQCTWLCGSHCPDGVISRGDDGFPVIDYEHCKGCMICLAQCPHHAIVGVPEAPSRGGGVA